MRNMTLAGFVLTVLFAFVASTEAAPVTLTGCLEKGHAEGEFRLTQASGGDAKQYDLIPAKDVDLKAHLGHKVEITGEKATEAEEKSREHKDSPHSHVKVTALKHLAATCP